MIERWLVAVRDHPDRPSALQRYVLACLALRMDWKTGCGYASARQLGADADASEPTVHRATRWARDNGLAVQTRRGHRVTSERTIASEWRLTQPLTGDLLEKPTNQNGHANRSAGPTQPLTGDAPSRTSSSRTSSSARGDGADAPRPPRAPPCPGCGVPFTAEVLADTGYRAAAMAGNLLHEECEAGS